MPRINRRSPYRNWRLDQSFGRAFTINRDTWQYDGLVSLWTCFGQNRGIVALRDEISHYNMTAVNTPTISTGELGPAVHFNRAIPEYLRVSRAVLTAVPVTLCCWFNADDITNAHTLVQIAENGAGLSGFNMQARGDVVGDPIYIWASNVGGGAGVATTSVGYTAGVWHHACSVFAANNSRAAYLDGGSKGTNAAAITPTGLDQINIGTLEFGAANIHSLSGIVAEARIYNRALTDAEVFALWEPSTRWDLYKPTARAFFMGPLVTAIPMPIIPLHGVHSVIGGGQIAR